MWHKPCRTFHPWCPCIKTRCLFCSVFTPLRWRRNGHGGVSNHQAHHCQLLNPLFGCRSKKTSKLRVTGLCAGNSPGPMNSPHKWPVTRKMFPFDDVIMRNSCFMGISHELGKRDTEYFARHLKWKVPSYRTHDEMITSLLHQNDIGTLFWRNNDVIITSCLR